MSAEEKEKPGTGGVLLELPAEALALGGGQVSINLDAIEGAILSMPLVKMAKFMGDDIPLLMSVLKSLEFAVIQNLEGKKLKEVPMGDGRKLVVKRSVSYGKPMESLIALKAKLEDMGFKEDVDFPKLFWEEDVPPVEAKKVQKIADADAIRKALILSGATEKEEQDKALGKSEGNPYLKVEGKIKSGNAKTRIQEAGKAIGEAPVDPFSR